MPPRLSLARSCLACSSIPSSSSVRTPFLPFLSLLAHPPQRQPSQAQPRRHASILSRLSDNPGAYNKRIRRGRGPSSGKGKTSGRGHKGQKQHGKVPAGFNGGQTPIEVVKGKRGFENQFSLEMSVLNVDKIQQWIDQGRLDPSQPITVKELCKSRCLHGVKDGVKLLARNKDDLKTPINIIVSRASTAAIEAVEKAGGTIQTRFYTKQSLGRIRRGLTDPIYSLQSQEIQSLLASTPTASATSDAAADTSENESESVKKAAEILIQYEYRLPDPTSRKDIEYYRDPAKRGYLAYQLKKGEGPSLFFRTPYQKRTTTKKATKQKSAENRVW